MVADVVGNAEKSLARNACWQRPKKNACGQRKLFVFELFDFIYEYEYLNLSHYSGEYEYQTSTRNTSLVSKN